MDAWQAGNRNCPCELPGLSKGQLVVELDFQRMVSSHLDPLILLEQTRLPNSPTHQQSFQCPELPFPFSSCHFSMRWLEAKSSSSRLAASAQSAALQAVTMQCTASELQTRRV